MKSPHGRSGFAVSGRKKGAHEPRGGTQRSSSSRGVAQHPSPVVMRSRIDPEQVFAEFVTGRLPCDGCAKQAAMLYAMCAYHGANVNDPLWVGVRAQPPFDGEIVLGHDGLIEACHDRMIKAEFAPAFDLEDQTRGGHRLVGVFQNGSRIAVPIAPLFGDKAARGIARYITERMERPPHQWPFYAGPKEAKQVGVWKAFAKS